MSLVIRICQQKKIVNFRKVAFSRFCTNLDNLKIGTNFRKLNFSDFKNSKSCIFATYRKVYVSKKMTCWVTTEDAAPVEICSISDSVSFMTVSGVSLSIAGASLSITADRSSSALRLNPTSAAPCATDTFKVVQWSIKVQQKHTACAGSTWSGGAAMLGPADAA